MPNIEHGIGSQLGVQCGTSELYISSSSNCLSWGINMRRVVAMAMHETAAHDQQQAVKEC